MTIEGWVGYALPAPDFVPGAEVKAIHDVAEIIRSGGSIMTFESFTLNVPRDQYKALRTDASLQFGIDYRFGLAVLGTEIPIGSLRGVVTEVDVVEERTDTDSLGEEGVSIRVTPRSEAARKPVFQLFKGGDAPT